MLSLEKVLAKPNDYPSSSPSSGLSSPSSLSSKKVKFKKYKFKLISKKKFSILHFIQNYHLTKKFRELEFFIF